MSDFKNKSGTVWRTRGKDDQSLTEAVAYVPGQNCAPLHSDEFQLKVDNNIWHDRDQLQKFLDTIIKLSAGENPNWSWAKNTECKYITLKIDMRDGGFIIMNRDGSRIDLPQLEWQYKSPDKNGG